MGTTTADVRELSGLPDNYTPEDGAVWFSPFRAYHVEDGPDDFLVSSEILKVRLVDGVAVVDLPETPVDNLMKVQLRGVRGYGAPWYVQIPAGDCNLFELAHIDPDTMDPDVPPSPAWLAALNARVPATGTTGYVLTKGAGGSNSWAPGGSGGVVNAEDVTVTPAGNITATDAQAALQELDDQRVAGDVALSDDFADSIALLAPKASPTFTGNPTAPTPAALDNDTSIATTAFVADAAQTPAQVRVQHRLGGTTEPGAFIAWTADDGYTTQPSFFALLASRGLFGTMFLSTAYVDKVGVDPTWSDTYITTAQVTALVAAGHELGTHGVNHEAYETYRIANGDAALNTLVSGAITTIAGFGYTVKTGAYPAGQSSQRVQEIMGRTHDFYRGTKGVVAHRGQNPYDVTSIDIRDLTEAAIKVYVDEANAAGSLVVFLVHGGLTAPMLTKFGNVMDYATGLGIRQGTFYQGMSERTAIRGNAAAEVDTRGNAYLQSLRTPRLELDRGDGSASAAPYFGIDLVTNAPFYDSTSATPFEFRKPMALLGDTILGIRKVFADGVLNSTTTVTSAAAGFNGADVGRTITGTGIPGGTTIASVTNATTAIMSAAATATASSVTITLGRPTPPVFQAAGQTIFYGAFQLRGTAPTIAFQDLANTATGTISPSTWSRAGAGGTMTIDSGSGGSYLVMRAYGEKFTDYLGTNVSWRRVGTGSPEGVWAAPVGSIYHRVDGGAGTCFYVKESGAATNTGWVAK